LLRMQDVTLFFIRTSKFLIEAAVFIGFSASIVLNLFLIYNKKYYYASPIK